MAYRDSPTTLKQRASQFAENDSFASNEFALDSNKFREVFELSIDQGEGYMLGRGSTANPQQAEGHIGVRLMDNTGTTAVQVTGEWKITVRAAGSGETVDVLAEGDLEDIDSRDASGNLKARENRKPFPQTASYFATHEYYIAFEVKPDSDVTVDTSPDSGNTEMYVDGWKRTKTA